MYDAEKQGMLSLDAKLIAASNMAVAKAIWDTYHAQKGGQPVRSSESLVLAHVKQAATQLEELAREIEADICANAPELSPIMNEPSEQKPR